MSFDLSKRFTQLLFVLILTLSIGLQWYGHWYGLLLTSDSYQYLSAAQSFKTNGVFLSPDGSYYTYWPPLFPVILSLFNNPEYALIWINVLVKIAIGFLIFFLAHEFLKRNIVKVLFVLVSLCAVQIIMISVFLWSELIFLFLFLLAISAALRMKSSGYFMLMLASLFLMCLKRNAGAFLVPAFSVWMMIDTSLLLKERIKKGVIIFIIGIAGLCFWNAYVSLFIPSNFYFYRHEFFTEFPSNFSMISETIARCFLPISGMLATFFGFIMFLVLIWSLKIDSYRTKQSQLISLLVLFYLLGFMAMGKLDVYEMDRYLSVIVPLVYLLFFMLIENSYNRLKTLSHQRILIAILVLGMIYPMVRTLKNTRLWNERSYSSDTSK